MIAITISLCACSTKDNDNEEQTKVNNTTVVSYDSYDLDENYEDENPQTVTLSKDEIIYSGNDAQINGTVFTIKHAGTYVFTGTLNDGHIIVDVDKKDIVRIVLKDASITSTTSSVIYVKQAEKILVTLAKDTKNTLCDGKTYTSETDASEDVKAAIYSKDDLTINGSGSLSVTAQYHNGIHSKDDLKIINSTVSVQSVDNGIIGKDLLAMKDATIDITAQGEGLRSSNTEKDTKGIVSLEGATVNIVAGQDGIQSENKLYIYDGNIHITAGEGHTNGTKMRQEHGFNPFEQQTANTEDTISMKGIKAQNELSIMGGTITIDSADDAIHSNSNITISGGTLQLSSGDDGIHSDKSLVIKKGTIQIDTSYEGLESEKITIHNGNIHINASDDGVNAAGTDPLLTVKGGTLFVYADGDGLDSNGDILMDGGTVIIQGTQSGGDGSLDFDGNFTINGGTLIASGSNSMLQYPTEVQNGCQVVIAFENDMNQLLHLETADGNNIITYQPSRTYQVITIYSKELKLNDTIEIYTGGEASSNKDGLYDSNTYQNGTLYKEVTLTDATTIIGTIRGGMNMLNRTPNFH